MIRSREIVWTVILLCELVWPFIAAAQDNHSIGKEMRPLGTKLDAAQNTEQNNILRPCSDLPSRDRAKAQAKGVAALPANYRNWLNEDALYLITPEERCAFLQLASNRERDQFIEQFWNRRAPAPYSLENGFKEEHYRRIVWANEKFGTDIPGWRTDRGRIYIFYGPPDGIQSHLIDQQSWIPLEDEPSGLKYSWEQWHYKSVEGVGQNIDLRFVNPAGSGEYSLHL
jgi:GWxTD domain-containing protein